MRNVPYISEIDYSKRILEIGPLDKPVIGKDKGPSVYYADIRSTKDIRQLYARDATVDKTAIKEIDFVVADTYQSFINEQKIDKFNYVVCSHVIEHVPLLLRFFLDISSVMTIGGKLCLSIPDHRYCFDHFRVPTFFAEAYDIHMHGLSRLAARVLDHSMNVLHNDTKKYWAKDIESEVGGMAMLAKKPFDRAEKAYKRVLSGEYIDVHFSVFTTISFVRLIFDAIKANMMPFRIDQVYPTRKNSLEFHIILELCNEMLDNDAVRRRELQKIVILIERIMEYEAQTCASISSSR